MNKYRYRPIGIEIRITQMQMTIFLTLEMNVICFQASTVQQPISTDDGEMTGRSILLAVDASDNAKYAFDCKLKFIVIL